MKLVQLNIKNVKKIKAAEIKPADNTVVITGKNAAGKSTILDSIAMALGGKDQVPGEPIRHGQSKGEIVAKLDDLIIERTFTKKGTKLKVTTPKGVPVTGGPQKALDERIGKLSFDPLAFMRKKPDERAAIVRELAGVDVATADKARAELYDRRHDLGVELRNAKAKADGSEVYEDVPDEEVSVAGLMEELKNAQETNAANGSVRTRLKEKIESHKALWSSVSEIEAKIKQLQKDKEDEERALREVSVEVTALQKEVDGLQDVMTDPISQRITQADEVNRKIRANQESAKAEAEADRLQDEYDKLTGEIAEIDEYKATALREAKLPIDGLSFTETGLAFNGTPFEQCSASEQLKVSVAMGMAMNPRLRLMLIRDGSLLDEESKEYLRQMADTEDYQVWLEVVESDDENAIEIEDGTIKE